MATRTDDTAFEILLRNSDYTRDRVDEMTRIIQTLLQESTATTLHFVQLDKDIDKLSKDIRENQQFRLDMQERNRMKEIAYQKWKWGWTVLGPILLITIYNAMSRFIGDLVRWYTTLG